MNDRDKEIVQRIIKYCLDVDSLMKKYQSNFQAYKADIAFQYACNMCIIQIGELVGRFSDGFLAVNDQIPWHAIKGMRNLHAHDYERVDLKIVWDTLKEDIPNLQKQLEKILRE